MCGTNEDADQVVRLGHWLFKAVILVISAPLLCCSTVCDRPVGHPEAQPAVKAIEFHLLAVPGHPEVVEAVEGCDDIDAVARILREHGFLEMNTRYDANVFDGCQRMIRVVYSDGHSREVMDFNANEPRFMAIVADVRKIEGILSGYCWQTAPPR